MIEKVKNYLIILLTAGLLFGLSIFAILKNPQAYSLSERRTLAQFPKFSYSQLENGKFMSQFEEYSLDQFPLRDSFRSLKAAFSHSVLQLRDNHGLYLENGYLSKLEYPQSPKRMAAAQKSLRNIFDTYLNETDCKIYLSIIPDKNCYLAPLGRYPSLDYPRFISSFAEQLEFAEYIDITPTLSLDDFYRTDPHWRQEALLDTASVLSEGMGVSISSDYTISHLDVPFYGSYYGQAALKVPPDDLYWLSNNLLDHCVVTSYNTGTAQSSQLYDMEKAHGRDPYEMFLSGSDALLVLENPQAETSRELVIFRDSFASSLTPLLASAYSKITLVDLRYIRSDMLGSFLEFSDQDVLFLYSTLLLNNNISM